MCSGLDADSSGRRGLTSQSKLTQSLSVAEFFSVGEFRKSIFRFSTPSAASVALLHTIHRYLNSNTNNTPQVIGKKLVWLGWRIKKGKGSLPLPSTRPAVTPQPLRGLLPILLLGEQRHNGCEQFAYLLSDSVATAIWTRALLRLSPAR